MGKKILFVIVSLILAIIVACTLGIGYVHEWNTEYMAVTASVIAAMATVIYSAFVYLQIQSSNKTIEIMEKQLGRETTPILINIFGDSVQRDRADYKKSIANSIRAKHEHTLALEINTQNAGRSEALSLITLVQASIEQTYPQSKKLDVKLWIGESTKSDHLFYYEDLMLKTEKKTKVIRLNVPIISKRIADPENAITPDEECVIKFKMTQYYKNIISQWNKTTFEFHQSFNLKELSDSPDDYWIKADNPINNTGISSLDEVINCLEHELNDSQYGEKAKTILMSLRDNLYAE